MEIVWQLEDSPHSTARPACGTFRTTLPDRSRPVTVSRSVSPTGSVAELGRIVSVTGSSETIAAVPLWPPLVAVILAVP